MKFFKKMGRILAMVCMLAIMTSQVTVQAKEVERAGTVRMDSIASYGTDLSISSKGVASINAYVNGKSGVAYTYVRAVLQKQTSSGWQEIESWKTSSNGRSAAIAETYQVTKGTYRVIAYFTADSESKSMTTANKTY